MDLCMIKGMDIINKANIMTLTVHALFECNKTSSDKLISDN